jgi:hypothetical protein
MPVKKVPRVNLNAYVPQLTSEAGVEALNSQMLLDPLEEQFHLTRLPSRNSFPSRSTSRQAETLPRYGRGILLLDQARSVRGLGRLPGPISMRRRTLTA